MVLELDTTSSEGASTGGIVFDEQYTFKWVDRTEPVMEEKYEKPGEKEKRFKVTLEIVDHPEGLKDAEGNDVDLIGRRVQEFYTVSLHTMANFGQVVRAIMGMKPDEEFADPKFNVDTLCASKNPDGYGGVFRATLRQKKSGWPKVTQPLPVRGAKNRNPTAAPSNEPPF